MRELQEVGFNVVIIQIVIISKLKTEMVLFMFLKLQLSKDWLYLKTRVIIHMLSYKMIKILTKIKFFILFKSSVRAEIV